MGWTKKQLILLAYDELALGAEFDISPEEEQTALLRLDNMMAQWDEDGIRLGYLFSASPDDSDIDAQAGIPDGSVMAVVSNLALNLAPSHGKVASGQTRKNASEGYSRLLSAAAMPRQQQMPSSLPQGAGKRTYFTHPGPFFCGPDENPLRIAQGGALDIPQDAP
jgi:P22 tail accessory factor